jgi:hypothetical protein
VAAGLEALAETYLERDGAGDPDRAADAAREARSAATEAGVEAYAILAASCLARAALKRGRPEEAARLSEQAVARLEAAEVAEAAEERVYFDRYLVLEAVSDPRAAAALRRAREIVARKADGIRDPDLRRRFEEQVPLNRQIIAAAAGLE